MEGDCFAADDDVRDVEAIQALARAEEEVSRLSPFGTVHVTRQTRQTATTIESGPRAARGPARDSEAPAPAVLPEAGNAKRSLRADREGASARLPTRMPTACPRRRRRTGPSWWAPLGLGRSSPQFILTRDVYFGRSIRTRSEWPLLVDCVDRDPDVADMPVRCGLPRRSSSDGGRAPSVIPTMPGTASTVATICAGTHTGYSTRT